MVIFRDVVLYSSVVVVLGAVGMSGCTVSGRQEPVGYYQSEPTYQQQPVQQPVTVYEQRRPEVVYQERGERRGPVGVVLDRLRQADAAIQANDFNGARDSLRSARDLLRNSPRDRGWRRRWGG